VSGDRLAQIEASARSPYQRAHADIGMDDVLALVEIAKQARRVVRCIDVERDVPYATAEALRSALARLDQLGKEPRS
jgi:hypothetical protein